MDTLDQHLLALLRSDARTSIADLAKALQVSRGTVRARIKRLEDPGPIIGYTVRLRPDSRSDEIKAWMSITIEGDKTREVIRLLRGEPGITALHDTNGRWDLLAEVRRASKQEASPSNRESLFVHLGMSPRPAVELRLCSNDACLVGLTARYRIRTLLS